MSSRKGISLSMNAIIIAALALIVLVVLVLIFTGQVGKTREGLNRTSSTYSGNTCEIPGTARQCRFPSQCQSRGGINYGTDFSDCVMNEVCCSE